MRHVANKCGCKDTSQSSVIQSCFWKIPLLWELILPETHFSTSTLLDTVVTYKCICMCVCVRTVKSYDLARYAKQARPGPESTLLVISGPGRVYLAYRAKSYNLTVLTRLQDHQFEPCSPRIRQWSDEIGGQHPFELLSP